MNYIPNEKTRILTKTFFELQPDVLPCIYCSIHEREHMMKNPIDNIIDQNGGLASYFINLHRAVNLRNKNPVEIQDHEIMNFFKNPVYRQVKFELYQVKFDNYRDTMIELFLWKLMTINCYALKQDILGQTNGSIKKDKLLAYANFGLQLLLGQKYEIISAFFSKQNDLNKLADLFYEIYVALLNDGSVYNNIYGWSYPDKSSFIKSFDADNSWVENSFFPRIGSRFTWMEKKLTKEAEKIAKKKKKSVTFANDVKTEENGVQTTSTSKKLNGVVIFVAIIVLLSLAACVTGVLLYIRSKRIKAKAIK